MSRFWWNPETKALEELTPYEEPISRTEIVSDAHYDGACATDGVDISTRRRHREYMRVNGLTTTDDFKETWAKRRAERDAFYSGTSAAHDKDVAKAVDKAWHKMQGKRR